MHRYDRLPVTTDALMGRALSAVLIFLRSGLSIADFSLAGQQLSPQPTCSAYTIEALREWGPIGECGSEFSASPSAILGARLATTLCH